jgi:uncharacterized repeat protein (TIGR01451 family)
LLPGGNRTVSGAIAPGSPLIDLNGARNVRIDGYDQLTLTNSTVSTVFGTSTVRFVNGAQNDTLANCTIRGSAGSGGVVQFSTGSPTAGNSNNIVIGNNIGPAGTNLPTRCVLSIGSAQANINNIISNNNLFDFFSPTASVTGISIQVGNDNWTISSNRIFQTAPRKFTAPALRYAGITIGAIGSFTITYNTIGFGAADGTGTTIITGSSNEFRGLDLPTTSPTAATSIQGNFISGINQTTSRNSNANIQSAFVGMILGTSQGLFDVGNLAGNTIGSLDGTSSIVINETSTTASTAPVIGIYDVSGSDDIIANNNIGSVTINSGGTGTVTGFRGILNTGISGQTITVVSNTIGGTAAGSITDNIVGNYSMSGIQNSSADMFANGNLVQNVSGNSNGAIVAMSGISIGPAGSGSSEISQNTIHSLNNSAGAAAGSIYAMDLTLSANANVIERNFIHSISATSSATGYQLWGIVKRGAGSATVRNNIVRLGIDSAGNPITSGFPIIGIRDMSGPGAAANYYFNSVYIAGTGVASASNTFAFFSDVVTNVRNFKNNIFLNARSNGTGSSANIAIAVGGTAPNPAGLTSNYNDLYATLVGGAVGLFNGVVRNTLSDWQTATGQDANSVSVDSLFVNFTGNAATVDLHIQSGSPVIGAGAPAAGTWQDFDLAIRNPSNPDIGADERNSFVPNVSISKTADAAVVSAGSQIGFTITLTNSTSGAATGLQVSDNLPSGIGVSWTIDPGNTSAGWSVSGTPSNQILVYSPTTLAGNSSTTAHVVSNTTSDSCRTYNNTASFRTHNDGSGFASASTTVLYATVAITKTADAASVSAGSQIGFTVTLTNSTAGTATGLSVTDNLPAGTDITWIIYAGNTDPGWSVNGSPPNQTLDYTPTTLNGNTSTTFMSSAIPPAAAAALMTTPRVSPQATMAPARTQPRRQSSAQARHPPRLQHLRLHPPQRKRQHRHRHPRQLLPRLQRLYQLPVLRLQKRQPM